MNCNYTFQIDLPPNRIFPHWKIPQCRIPVLQSWKVGGNGFMEALHDTEIPDEICMMGYWVNTHQQATRYLDNIRIQAAIYFGCHSEWLSLWMVVSALSALHVYCLVHAPQYKDGCCLWLPAESADGKFMVPTLVHLFQGFQEKMEVMFAEIREEFITICKKIDKRVQLWEQENREFNKKIDYNFSN